MINMLWGFLVFGIVEESRSVKLLAIWLLDKLLNRLLINRETKNWDLRNQLSSIYLLIFRQNINGARLLYMLINVIIHHSELFFWHLLIHNKPISTTILAIVPNNLYISKLLNFQFIIVSTQGMTFIVRSCASSICKPLSWLSHFLMRF